MPGLGEIDHGAVAGRFLIGLGLLLRPVHAKGDGGGGNIGVEGRAGDRFGSCHALALEFGNQCGQAIQGIQAGFGGPRYTNLLCPTSCGGPEGRRLSLMGFCQF